VFRRAGSNASRRGWGAAVRVLPDHDMKFSTGFTLAIAALLISAGVARAQPAADTPVNPFLHDPAAVAAGEKIFNSTCTVCHGTGGSGGRGPALNTGSFAHGGGDYDIFQTIRSGVTGTQMPAFTRFSSDDVWRLTTYIKSL